MSLPRLNKTWFLLQARLGTEADIVATSPAPTQIAGEFAFSTDSKRLFVSDGTAFAAVANNGETPIADGTYTVGKGSSQDGTITVTNGVITGLQEASDE